MPPSSFSTLSSFAQLGIFHTTALLCGIISIRSVLCDVQKVTGSSMAPTISPNFETDGGEDTILVSKIRRGLRDNNEDDGQQKVGMTNGTKKTLFNGWNIHQLRRGDVVTFWSPLTGQPSLKRVVALGGDAVQPEKRVRFGKGYRLPGPREESDATTNGLPEQFVVPYGHLWLEGDNPDSSQDSRDFGPVS